MNAMNNYLEENIESDFDDSPLLMQPINHFTIQKKIQKKSQKDLSIPPGDFTRKEDRLYEIKKEKDNSNDINDFGFIKSNDDINNNENINSTHTQKKKKYFSNDEDSNSEESDLEDEYSLIKPDKDPKEIERERLIQEQKAEVLRKRKEEYERKKQEEKEKDKEIKDKEMKRLKINEFRNFMNKSKNKKKNKKKLKKKKLKKKKDAIRDSEIERNEGNSLKEMTDFLGSREIKDEKKPVNEVENFLKEMDLNTSSYSDDDDDNKKDIKKKKKKKKSKVEVEEEVEVEESREKEKKLKKPENKGAEIDNKFDDIMKNIQMQINDAKRRNED